MLISAVPPLMLKTDRNPTGVPIAVFDGLRAQLAANRPQFYWDITLPFYGYNRPGAKLSEGIRNHWWLQGMLGGMKPHYDCIKAFSATDFTEHLRKLDVPTLIFHGDDDQIVPIRAAAMMSSKIVKRRQAEGISRLSARDAHNPRRPDQCRSARVLKRRSDKRGRRDRKWGARTKYASLHSDNLESGDLADPARRALIARCNNSPGSLLLIERLAVALVGQKDLAVGESGSISASANTTL